MSNYIYIKSQLELKGTRFDMGLSLQEFQQIESKYNFVFPPDLKEFLSLGLPVSEKWVNWRSEDEKAILERLNWPYEGICFDIEHNDFWHPVFGGKPGNLNDRFLLVKDYLNKVPKLIPIYSHRYMPDRPNEKNNPVLSVYQTDIIYYGRNLENYLVCEFDLKAEDRTNTDDSIKNIEFWSNLVELNDQK